MSLFNRGRDKAAESAGRRVPVTEPVPEDHDRYMNLAVAKHNGDIRWRITAAILAVSVGFNGFYMFQSKFIPVLVAIDNIGHKIYVGPVNEAKPVDVERVLLREVAEFIEFARSVTGDNALQKKRLAQVGNRIPKGSPAENVVRQLWASRDPFKTAETQGITVDIKTVLRQSPKSWHVEWVETTRSLNGEIQAEARWKAVLSYQIVPQDRPDTIENNPVGFFAQDLSWARMP